MQIQGAGDRKVCPMCQMEISAKAKKCPYCQHFQSRLSFVLFHPAVPFVGYGTFLVVAFGLLGDMFFDEGEHFESFAGQVEIVDGKMVFGDRKDSRTVAVIATMRNNSEVAWKEVTFQVEFKDGQGRIIDAGQKSDYFFHAPAKQSVPIKLSFAREFAETNYVGHSIRVIAAKDGRTRW